MEYFFTDNILIQLKSNIIELSDNIEHDVKFKLDSDFTNKLFLKNPDLKDKLLISKPRRHKNKPNHKSYSSFR